MKRANKITTAEHNDNFYMITAGIFMGMAFMAITHLFFTVIM